mgnify:CR=1 FL=1
MEYAPQPFIYLDHNATTPLDPAVVDAMMGVIKGEFGNPSSSYPLGQKAKDLMEDARKEVALLLARLHEVVRDTGGKRQAQRDADEHAEQRSAEAGFARCAGAAPGGRGM